MPFTLSHPAAIVPIARKPLVLSALVAGSMAPDFPYFIFAFPAHRLGHSLSAVFYFCLPIGMAVLFLFHKVLKRPLFSLLPSSHQRRLVPMLNSFRFGPPRHFLLVALSLMLGAFTHIFWDSFTHESGWAVRGIGLLDGAILQETFGGVRVYKILQHSSTLAGAVLLIYWYMRWYKQASEYSVEPAVCLSGRSKFYLLLSAGLSATLVAVSYGHFKAPVGFNLGWIKSFTYYSVIVAMSVISIEVILFSIFWHVMALRGKVFVKSR